MNSITTVVQEKISKRQSSLNFIMDRMVTAQFVVRQFVAFNSSHSIRRIQFVARQFVARSIRRTSIRRTSIRRTSIRRIFNSSHVNSSHVNSSQFLHVVYWGHGGIWFCGKFKCLFRLYRYSGISDVKMRNRQRRLTSARDKREGRGEGREGDR